MSCPLASKWWILQDEAAVEISQRGAGEEKLQAERLQESDRWDGVFKESRLSSSKMRAVWGQMCGCRGHREHFSFGIQTPNSQQLVWPSELFFQRKTWTEQTERTGSTKASTIPAWFSSMTSSWRTACTTLTWVRLCDPHQELFLRSVVIGCPSSGFQVSSLSPACVRVR